MRLLSARTCEGGICECTACIIVLTGYEGCPLKRKHHHDVLVLFWKVLYILLSYFEGELLLACMKFQ